MKKSIKWQLIALLGVFIISSCATSNDVVSGHLISKRKYNKGFHLNFNKSYKLNNATTTAQQEDEIVESVPTNPSVAYPIVEENTNSSTLNAEENNSYQPLSKDEVAVENETNSSQKINRPLVSENLLNHSKSSQKIITFVEKTKEKQTSNKGGDSDVKLILLVILAFLISPLAMYLADGQTDLWFILDLIFYLFWISWVFAPNLGFVGLASIVIALLRVFSVI